MSECEYNKIEDYKSAFNCFKQRFLIKRKSIFNLSDVDTDCKNDENTDKDCCVLTKENLDYLIENFVNNGYGGDASFIDKIKKQLIDSPKNTFDKENDKLEKLQAGALEILATAIWLWRLAPYNAKDRKSGAQEILDLIATDYKISDDNQFFANYKGFASTGTYYNTNKPFEVAYILIFFQKILSLEDLSEENMVVAINEIVFLASKGKMQISTKYENKNIACLWKKGLEGTDKGKQDISKAKVKKQEEKLNQPDISEKDKDYILKPTKSVAMYNALLHFIQPDDYEPILSIEHKQKIKDIFSSIFSSIKFGENVDIAIKSIKEEIIKKIIIEDNGRFFYNSKIINIWQSGLDFESKNIILHGAPGTGKTYITEETIKARKDIEHNIEYKLIQFHPSYGYEDFIEGIKPTEIIKNSGQMKFELKNGVFKQMCIDAFKNLIKSQKKPEKLKTYYFIADEINRAELSRVFGELLLCLEDDKRLKIVDSELKGTKIDAMPNSNLWKAHHAVVILDENDNLVEPTDEDIYNIEENDEYKYFFGVPENIYFIGTMNDIDRSVDSFDMALRRRFIWKHYSCDYDVILNNYKDEVKSEEYVEVCEKLNTHITDVKGLNLGSSYELGHSYFMKPETLNQVNLDKVWIENISPLLKEYIRASEPNENEIDKLIKLAKNIFKL